MSAPITKQPGHEFESSNAALIGTNQWSTGTFGCTNDCGDCLCHICCLSCLMGLNAQKMNESFCAGCMFPIATDLVLRTKLRERHRLEGDLCGDLVCGICCFPCMACQTSRELNNLGYR